jgi:biopolymer transport protein ExbB/TolQ
MSILILQSVPWAGSKRLEFTAIILLSVMSLFAALVIIKNFVRVRRAIKASYLYAPEIAWALSHLNWKAAIKVSERYIDSHLAVLVLAALRCREDHKDGVAEPLLIKFMNNAMQAQIMFLQNRHQNYLSLVQAIGASAPIIGAVGGSSLTVSFAIVFAVPAVWLGYYLRKVNERLEIEAKNSANEFMLFVEKVLTLK